MGDSTWLPIRDIAEPGVKAERELAITLRREVANLLGRQTLSFPGAQPVSFGRHHLEELRRKDYYVCEKSDGIRYLLYVTEDEEGKEAAYLIDRKNEYWFIEQRNLHFPLIDEDQAFHSGTLIDGELVMDDMGNGNKQPRFLVFDCLALDGKSDLMSRPLDKRLGYFKEHIMKPYKDLFRRYPQELAQQAFVVEMKEMQVAYGIEMMFREVLPKLRHGNDGLIFTCRESEYHHGTDPNILKWKPVSENTIDFRLRLVFPTVEPDADERAEGIAEPFVDYESVPAGELYAYVGDNGPEPYRFYSRVYISEDDWETLKALNDPLQDRVVECGLDDRGQWIIHRFRDDKPEANHVSTVNSVEQSIADSVSQEDLMAAALGIRDSWKSRAAGHGKR